MTAILPAVPAGKSRGRPIPASPSWPPPTPLAPPAGRGPIAAASASTWAKARAGSNFAGPSAELPCGVVVTVGAAVGVGAVVGGGVGRLGAPLQAGGVRAGG